MSDDKYKKQIEFLVKNPKSPAKVPDGLDLVTKEQVGRIREDAKIDLDNQPKLKKFLQDSMAELEIKGDLRKCLNKFMEPYTGKKETLSSLADFGNNHLAAVYIAMREKGKIQMGNGTTPLEKTWGGAQDEVDILNKAGAVGGRIGSAISGGIGRFKDKIRSGTPEVPKIDVPDKVKDATDAAKDTTKKTRQAAGTVQAAVETRFTKTSEAIESLKDKNKIHLEEHRELKVFVAGALGKLGHPVADTSDKAMLKSLNDYLGTQYFESLKTLKDFNAEHLKVLFKGVADKKGFDKDMTAKWEAVREDLGLPKGMKMSDLGTEHGAEVVEIASASPGLNIGKPAA